MGSERFEATGSRAIAYPPLLSCQQPCQSARRLVPTTPNRRARRFQVIPLAANPTLTVDRIHSVMSRCDAVRVSTEIGEVGGKRGVNLTHRGGSSRIIRSCSCSSFVLVL